MSQPALFAETPTCPQCRAHDLRAESGDIHQCGNCHQRCRVAQDGTTRPLVDITTAGRKRRGKRR